MDDERNAFIIGASIAALLVIGVVITIEMTRLNACESEHNVHKCVAIYVPKESK